MTIKGMRGTVAGLVVLAAAVGGVAGAAVHQSAPAVRADQAAATYAVAGPQDTSCTGQGTDSNSSCTGASNTNWG
ncbi:MAG TPA: hypothetical protein VKV34_01315 [Thermoleophilia bacterium]|jgi:hypothetical protein|nr:hypothetical protein [Thermoleophilia bacterium]